MTKNAFMSIIRTVNRAQKEMERQEKARLRQLIKEDKQKQAAMLRAIKEKEQEEKLQEKEAARAYKQEEKNFIDYGIVSLKNREKIRQELVDKVFKSIYK